MSDNVLKKQFQKRDVERLRNLVKGKHGDRTTIGVGYNGETQEEHKEGDVWEQGGKNWTIRDGIKECKQIMDKQLDPFYFKSYGHCLDCRTKFETQLKIKGKWENYVNSTFNAEIDQQIEEYKGYFESILSEGNQNYVSENGEIQKWVGGIDKERAQNALDEMVKHLNSLKK